MVQKHEKADPTGFIRRDNRICGNGSIAIYPLHPAHPVKNSFSASWRLCARSLKVATKNTKRHEKADPTVFIRQDNRICRIYFFIHSHPGHPVENTPCEVIFRVLCVLLRLITPLVQHPVKYSFSASWRLCARMIHRNPSFLTGTLQIGYKCGFS